ncbi:MAG: hypothetical protein HYW97_02085 [Candidatus Wildermuthbacteria bacterium]|nr:hypothetical protein [Candidatus Wildermuthbacteria bacterium]
MKKHFLFILILLGIFLVFGAGIEKAHAVNAGDSCTTAQEGTTTTGDVKDKNGVAIEAGVTLKCLAGKWIKQLAGPASGGLPENVPTEGDDLIARIGTITNWVFAVFITISIIYIVLAAFQFVTGGGKPEEVSLARQKLIYAVIGIAIALLARALPIVLRNVVI